MKKLKEIYQKSTSLLIIFTSIFIFSSNLYSNENLFEINGNNFTDSNVIISLLGNIPENLNEEYSNEIIKILNESNLFSDVRVIFVNNKYKITVTEFPIIDRLNFDNNERLKDEDLEIIAAESNLTNLNMQSINLFILEVKKIYESYGYNNVKIDFNEKFKEETNTVDLFFNINEGKITKINNIYINGNNYVSSEDLKSVIQSKIKTIRNIFANNNYKPNTIDRDKIIISEYYRNKGFLDVKIDTKVEYLKSDKVNIYFTITEGEIYSLSSIKFSDEKNILSPDILKLIKNKIIEFSSKEKIFSIKKIQNLKSDISSLIIDNGIDFFEITYLDSVDKKNIDILFQIDPIKPKYTNQINIVGNSRTFDYVIRRELDIIEGDAIYKNQIQNIRNKLISLNLFESVFVKEEVLDNNKVNLIIEVEEKQTGSFNAGVSIGTLDGFAIVTGLRERNFYGTGRSLDVLVNTAENKNQFKIITSDRLSNQNDANISYSINYKQEDFSNASSYKLDTFSSSIGIGYRINNNLFHNVDLEYVLKDYSITNSASVSNSILNSSGAIMSYLVKNNLRYSTLNPGFISKEGNYFNFNNTIETPTSSNNGFVRNIIILKKYHSINRNIFSIQTKFGNIFSLNNSDILTDDKFALGGRWLRGFDNFGAGPRNSRTSYIGGNNLAVAKLDYSYELSNNSNFPIYLNLFNDYGLLWDNKTAPTNNDSSLRSSAGFGIRYYSPIGPIGFTWGFPIMDENYDIKRMFLFSIGNID